MTCPRRTLLSGLDVASAWSAHMAPKSRVISPPRWLKHLKHYSISDQCIDNGRGPGAEPLAVGTHAPLPVVLDVASGEGADADSDCLVAGHGLMGLYAKRFFHRNMYVKTNSLRGSSCGVCSRS